MVIFRGAPGRIMRKDNDTGKASLYCIKWCGIANKTLVCLLIGRLG